MSNQLLALLRDEYQQAPPDTYTNDMHRALWEVLVSMQARITELEATVARLDSER